MTIDLGDVRKFARVFGQWLYGANPELDADKLQTIIKRFAMTAPIGVADGSALSLDEFCTEAVSAYTQAAETSDKP